MADVTNCGIVLYESRTISLRGVFLNNFESKKPNFFIGQDVERKLGESEDVHGFYKSDPQKTLPMSMYAASFTVKTPSRYTAKRQWLSERLNEGHVFKKLQAKATVFIEYAPIESAWVPIIGDTNYYYILFMGLGRVQRKRLWESADGVLFG